MTGSTHGIGKAYAQELASKGVNIVIVSLGDEDCFSVSQSLGTMVDHIVEKNDIVLILGCGDL